MQDGNLANPLSPLKANMNIRKGIFRLWVVVSGLWLLGDGIIWYPDFAAQQTQLAALDKCGKLYQPLPEGFELNKPANAADPANAPWLLAPPVPPSVTVTQLPPPGTTTAPQSLNPQDPDCAPNVGTIALTDFISMHQSDREAFRRQSVGAIRASAITAATYGVAVPIGLLAIGMVFDWVMRGFRLG
jgi:hypothetical protein